MGFKFGDFPQNHQIKNLAKVSHYTACYPECSNTHQIKELTKIILPSLYYIIITSLILARGNTRLLMTLSVAMVMVAMEEKYLS